jgi:FKBP-type peptidyl-prolyl cis-trans isomerase
MKAYAFVALLSSIVVCGCGTGGSAAPHARHVAVAGPNGTLRVAIPRGQPPKKLVVKDIRVGSGPAVRHLDDEIVVKYVGLEYDGTRPFYDSWETGGPSRFLLEETHPGWERGLWGMRAGGMRELITPPWLEYGGTATFVYVIEMVQVNRSPR